MVKHKGGKHVPKKALSKKHKYRLRMLTIAGALLVLILFGAVLQRLDIINTKNAALTPRANHNIAVMNLVWKNENAVAEEMFTPNEGSKLISVDVQILNMREQQIWLAPSVESYVKDKNGQRHGMALADAGNEFVAGVYQPQRVASGNLTYVVPSHGKDLSWCYELSIANGGGDPVCVALNEYSSAQ